MLTRQPPWQRLQSLGQGGLPAEGGEPAATAKNRW